MLGFGVGEQLYRHVSERIWMPKVRSLTLAGLIDPIPEARHPAAR
jgi:hypothetical protein